MSHGLRPPLLFRSLLALGLAACGDSTSDLPDASGSMDAGLEDTGVNTDPDAGGEEDSGVDAGPGEDAGSLLDEPYRTLQNTGLPAERFDIVVVGDGYAAGDIDGRYVAHVNHLAGRIFNRVANGSTEPFYQLRRLFNLHRIHLESNESGIDEGGEERDTALDGTTACGQLGTTVCYVDPAKVRAAVSAKLEGSDITPDLIVVVLNTNEDLEGIVEDDEGKIAVYGGGPDGDLDVDTSERALRQMARVMADLAVNDPGAGAYSGDEPDALNLTLSSSGEKWSAWLGFDEPNDSQDAVAAYEGGGGSASGVYRPVGESKLTGDYPAPFDPVAREALFLAIMEVVPPVVSHTPNTSALTNPPFLDLIIADPSLTSIRWSVDGVEVDQLTDTRFGFTGWAMANGVGAGEHNVEARVTMQTRYRFPDCRRCRNSTIDFVRRGAEALEPVVQWQVLYGP